jgi:prolyl oligopeptidase
MAPCKGSLGSSPIHFSFRFIHSVARDGGVQRIFQPIRFLRQHAGEFRFFPLRQRPDLGHHFIRAHRLNLPNEIQTQQKKNATTPRLLCCIENHWIPCPLLNVSRESVFFEGMFKEVISFSAAVCLFTQVAARADSFDYPKARRGNQVDDYHGTKIADPYRWLENPDAPESREWIDAQNKITFGFLEKIPARPKIKARLTELWNYERYGVPFKQGPRYFLTRNDGLQNQSVLYWLSSLAAEPKVLLDPNTLTKDGTIALKGYAVSEDGEYLAYGLSTAGSDWEEWRVRKVSTAKDTDDVLKWVKFSGASWAKDGSGIFYSRYDEPNESQKLQSVNYFQKLYFHKRDTPQSEDVLVYHRPDKKEWMFGGGVTQDGRYLIISIREGTEVKNRVYYKELPADFAPKDLAFEHGSTAVELLNDFDASYEFVGNDGPIFWFQTDREAPRGKIIAIDTRRPQREHWKVLIPESADTIRGATVVNRQFIVSYMRDAKSAVRIFDLAGKPARDLTLPGIGTAAGFTGEQEDSETFYAFTSFTSPSTIYRYDLRTGENTVFRQPKLMFDASRYETRQVKFHSKDGTQVPMFIVHRKDLKLDGDNPTLLYAYGGFNISLTPSFSSSTMAWLEMGGVYAQPNLRGGGEYGEEWHQAGTKLRKQNVFDDFIGAAQWLIEHNYTKPEKLAIAGGSNGGLLVGASITQQPELFGAALPAVGVMDMLRFHKFTIGWAWTSDYGSADHPEEFKALRAYSPLHNLKSGTKYPSTMVTTADHDDRVVPAHSFKFAAALQHAHAGDNPVLIRIETKAGHGAGKPTSKIIDEAADRYAFLVKTLNIETGD